MYAALRKDRIAAAAGAVLLEGALLYALIAGLWVHGRTAQRGDSLTLFEVTMPKERVPPPPPPPVRANSPQVPRPDSIRSKATPLSPPEPIVALPPVQPITAAPAPSLGTVSGTPLGEERATSRDRSAPARQVAGALSRLDFPRWASGRVGGTVVLRYSVETDGRVGTCDIAKSSGSARLDEYTCTLVRKRYRFEPMRDGAGQAARTYISASYIWVPWKPSAAE